jgi:hypothetical protein
MNRRTFQDAVASRVSSLANEIDDDEDDREVSAFRGNVEGEEEEGNVKVRINQFRQSIHLGSTELTELLIFQGCSVNKLRCLSIVR